MCSPIVLNSPAWYHRTCCTDSFAFTEVFHPRHKLKTASSRGRFTRSSLPRTWLLEARRLPEGGTPSQLTAMPAVKSAIRAMLYVIPQPQCRMASWICAFCSGARGGPQLGSVPQRAHTDALARCRSVTHRRSMKHTSGRHLETAPRTLGGEYVTAYLGSGRPRLFCCEHTTSGWKTSRSSGVIFHCSRSDRARRRASPTASPS